MDKGAGARVYEGGVPGAEPEISASIQEIKGVGPNLARVLSKKGIKTIEDALYFLPRAYEDRSRLTPIRELVSGQTATVLGKVVSASSPAGRGRQRRFNAVVTDGTGMLSLTWFHAYPSLAADFAPETKLLIHGEVRFFGGMPSISHPDYERVTTSPTTGKPVATMNFGRVVPVYSETEGLHQKTVRRIMSEVLKVSLHQLEDPLPQLMRTKLALPDLKQSFAHLHFPVRLPAEGESSDAVRRIIFEEFFVLQLGLGLKKRKRQREKAPPLIDPGGIAAKFIEALPFPLTGDQKKAVAEIGADLRKPQAMARLLQGDVGAGKTVVALAGAAAAAGSGYQTAIMAPTEILAIQHFKTAEKFLVPLGVNVELVTQASAAKAEVRERVADGSVSVVIGTHALFQKQLSFAKLGLVVVDEQHRFGVDQRNELVKKGDGLVPHLLMMTATPIPRTLSLTLYGDLDLTLLREKPAGRQPVLTTVVREKDRPRLYQEIRRTVERGEQVYVIYPLVEASEKLELKSATEQYDRLRKEVFPELSIALLHGRMKAEQKDEVLADFKAGKYQILVSTTVIEVGIDVANATLMVIEHPERLGLSQLHQLRGRVGRGEAASRCLLVAESFVGQRLKVMEQTEDGFVIAEEDLKIRGPGEFLGTRQSGLPGFRVGHILRDADLLGQAREEADLVLQADPELAAPEHRGIRSMVESRWRDKIERLRGG